MINCAYIGFGKSATRYHLPYVLCRKDKYNVKRIYDIARKPEVEAQPHYQHICFTSRLQDILEDNTLQLVVICTHPDSHFEYARLCLAHGKNVLVEKPFTTTPEEAKTLFALAREKGLTVSPFQNRRFDSCYLTMKQAIESGKLGEVRIESHFDYFRPASETCPGSYFDGAFYGLGVHTLINYRPAGRPQQVGYHLQRQRNPLNPDDAFTVHLYYPKTTANRENQPSGENTRAEIHGTRYARIVYSLWYRPAGNQPEGGHYALGTQGLVKIVNARCWSISMTQDVLSGRNCRRYPATTDAFMTRFTTHSPQARPTMSASMKR